MTNETEEQLQRLVKNSPKEFLRPEEKMAIKNQLIDFIKQHPVKNNVTTQGFWALVSAMFGQKTAMRSLSLAAACLLVTSGGIAFAAQQALPGDLLYSVKTGISEKILALTLFSDQAKAEYNINLAQLRLQETESIAYQDKLDNKTSAEVRGLLHDHIANIQNRIANIKSKEKERIAIELNSNLEALLKAHGKVLDGLAEKNQQNSSVVAINSVLLEVKTKTDETIKNRQSNEADFSLQISDTVQINADEKFQELQLALEEAVQLADAKKSAISELTYQKLKADLALAKQYSADGQQRLAVKDYTGAYIFFQNALTIAKEVHIYTKVEGSLLK